jgi:[ribosomal protein S18]-alanine N-acetyltransferase
LAYTIRNMLKKDIPQVTEIDREAFATMWPPVNFNHELTNRLAYYHVACDGQRVVAPSKPSIRLVPVRTFWGIKWPFSAKPASEPPPEIIDYITGFVGVWMMVDEAHIVNIAVRSTLRHQGIGELLLISSIDLAAKLNAQFVTLEVRRSNTIAQSLYSKYGFNEVGLRKGYYTDNKEDALIMTTDLIATDNFIKRFSDLKNKHFNKLKDLKYSVQTAKGD